VPLVVSLIRHGQSLNNALPDSQRVDDPGLTDLGKRQAEHLGCWQPELPVQHLFCSPFLRSLETTVPLAAQTGILPAIRADLFEQGGCYAGNSSVGKKPRPGMGSEKLAERFPEWEVDPRIAPEGWWHGRQYESHEEATARAQQVKQWLEQEVAQQSQHAALVIHADFKERLLEAIMGLVPDEVIDYPIYNTSITQLTWDSRRWVPHSINRVAHLPPGLLSH
jgi:broad specificity phosphatase PhoE